MKRTVKIFGRACVIEFHEPTNEEYNKYSNAVNKAIKDKDDDAMIIARARQFDAWAEKVSGIDKAAIPDRLKSSIVFQIFDYPEVLDEKN